MLEITSKLVCFSFLLPPAPNLFSTSDSFKTSARYDSFSQRSAMAKSQCPYSGVRSRGLDFHKPSHDLLSCTSSCPHSPRTGLSEDPQTPGAGSPSEPWKLLFLLLWMLFLQVSSWHAPSLIPSPSINTFLVRTSLTTYLESNSSTSSSFPALFFFILLMRFSLLSVSLFSLEVP